MKKYLLLIGVIAVIFSACGPSKEELERRELARQDSIKTVADSAKTKSVKAPAYYSASDFGLVPGKIIRWTAGDGIADDQILDAEKEGKTFTIYVHIQQEDGTIKVMQASTYAWDNLYEGDMLK